MKNQIIFSVGFIIAVITGFIVMSFYYGWYNVNDSKNLEFVKLSFYTNLFSISFLFFYAFVDRYKWGIIFSIGIAGLSALSIKYLIDLPQQYIIIILPLTVIVNPIVILITIWKIYRCIFPSKSEKIPEIL